MPLNIKNLNKILDDAEPLKGMGIKIKEISRDNDIGVYAAEIDAGGKVTPHFHPDKEGGTEWYYIIESGINAIMYTGKPIYKDKSVVDVQWDAPNKINKGKFFEIPNGIVHSLVAGDKKLRFVFRCPDAHLDDNLDKIVLEGFSPIENDKIGHY